MAPELEETPQPWDILRIVDGYRHAKVLLAAWRLDVVTPLADHARTTAELAAELAVRPDALRDVLHALVGLQLLTRDGDGRYHPTAAAEAYLSRSSRDNLGGLLNFLDEELYPAWDGLVEHVRTGRPATAAARADDPYGELYQAPSARDAFLETMDFINTPLAEQLAALDWSGHHTIADIGGARGNLSAILARTHPHLTATVFDLPRLRPAFDKHIAELGLADRVAFRAGDFFHDPLPEADALILGHVLHNWPEQRRIALLAKAFDAVRPGGALYVYDAMLDDDTPRLNNALVSLDMRVWSAGGAEYTAQQCAGWLAEVGFTSVTRHPHGRSSSVLIGRKPH